MAFLDGTRCRVFLQQVLQQLACCGHVIPGGVCATGGSEKRRRNVQVDRPEQKLRFDVK